MSLTIGSLFSGIGGLELGLEWAGLGPTLWQVEQSPFCRAVLAKHWPDATRYEDVCNVGRSNLTPVDVICGGFPCQDISVAGRGAGLAGERSGLWSEYARIVREIRPRYVVVENVSALLGRGLDVVLGELASCGYDAWWDCIPASAVGAAHRRDRLFIVAYAEREGWKGSLSHNRVPGRSATAHAFPLHAAPFTGLALDNGRGRLRDRNGVSVAVERRRLHAIGNAVVPQVAEVVGRLIVAHAARHDAEMAA